MIKENSFSLKQKKNRSRRYPAETMRDEDYADDLAPLTNTPALLQGLKQAEEATDHYVIVYKTEFMYSKYARANSLNSKPLRLVEHFPYLGSNISSTESEVNIRIGKTWTVICRLSIIWKSDLCNKIRREFFQAVSVLLYSCTTWTLMNCFEKNLNGNYTKTLRVVWKKS